MTTKTSLFIPHIFANISEERIKSVIENAAKYGQVEQIDLVPKKNADGKAYNSAYIHMKSWNQDEKTQKFLAHLKDTSKQTHIIYDKPWFWIVLKNTSSDKKKTKTLDMKEFPPLTAPGAPLKPQATVLTPPGTPEEVWASLREPEPVTPPRANRDLPLPGAPTRKPKAITTTTAGAVRNLNQELEYNEYNMNLVDADYVYHMEQDNTQLRNENDMLKDENCELEREIDKLRDMLVEMITIRGGSTQQMQRMFQQMYQRGEGERMMMYM